MRSLRDQLRAIQTQPRQAQPAAKPRPQDCLIRETRFPLPGRLSLPAGIFPFMQLDAQLPESLSPESLLFLDTETTGLSGGAGTVAFLVGVGEIRQHELIVRQYLMRDYDEEAFVLRHVQAHLSSCQLLITYNGKSFDMPLLASRFVMHRMRLPELPHADLLHAARRVWKLRLGRCSLSALEDKIYHEPRVDDLSGAEVPQRYFDYLKSHDMSLLEDILRHNAQDIATLTRLTYTLSSLHDNPLSAEHTQDIFSLGRVCERGGQLERARVCYRAADSGVMSALCRERLADTLRREHSDAEAAAIYEKMIAARQGGAQPYIALAKLLEHRLHDVNKAANIARRGLLYLTDRPSLSPREQAQLDDLTHRCARLLQKKSRQS